MLLVLKICANTHTTFSLFSTYTHSWLNKICPAVGYQPITSYKTQKNIWTWNKKPISPQNEMQFVSFSKNYLLHLMNDNENVEYYRALKKKLSIDFF